MSEAIFACLQAAGGALSILLNRVAVDSIVPTLLQGLDGTDASTDQMQITRCRHWQHLFRRGECRWEDSSRLHPFDVGGHPHSSLRSS